MQKTTTTTSEGKIDLPHWIENATPEKIAQDSLLPLADQYQAQLADPEIYVVIATARVMSQADLDYVKNVLGQPNKIISRKMGETTKGSEMKIAGLRFLKNLKQFSNVPKTFYEDNKDYLYEQSRLTIEEELSGVSGLNTQRIDEISAHVLKQAEEVSNLA